METELLKLNNQNVKTKAVNRKSIKNQKLHQLRPWSAQWMRVKFNYLDPITDDSVLTKKEKVQNEQVRQRVLAFAEQRKNYRYQLIANNARDLGGYYTKSGHQVKTGLLVRSDNLHNLNYFGKQVMERLNVNNVIDLRSLHEAKQAPDLVSKNIFHLIPVYSEKGVNRSRNKTFQYGVIYRYGSLFLTTKHAQNAYRKIIKSIAYNDGASLFHCVEGRDRTGLVAVLLLTALGVDKQTIINDYLLTDYYAHTKPYIKQLEQINHFYATAHKLYGNVWDYMMHIGVTLHDVHVLRAKYLN